MPLNWCQQVLGHGPAVNARTDTLDGSAKDQDLHALCDGTDQTAEFEKEDGSE